LKTPSAVLEKLKALCTVSEVLWTLIQETTYDRNLWRPHTCHAQD